MIKLSAVERQQKIAEQIERQRRITIDEICTHFRVSQATARRDLETLADQGRIQRVHGGAIYTQVTSPESPVIQRRSEQTEEKKRIGAVAAGMVRDGESLFISSGTTSLEVALHLRDHKNLTVVTNSLLVLDALVNTPAINMIMLGGMLRSSEMSVLGHITEQAMAELRVDWVFLGIRAIHAQHGLTSEYLPEVMTDRAILRIGREIVVVADHTKLGMVSTAYVAPISAIHTLITDRGASEERIQPFLQQGIRILLA